jgi:hypothetical protein
MTLQDVTASILLFNHQHANFQKAKEDIFNTFKKEFPYWSFSDWNVELSLSQAKSILKINEESRGVTVKQLIEDLPALITALKTASST